MPLEKETSIPEERLSPEDLDAIRQRLSDGEGNLPDRRDYGAFTLTDVAEAFNLPPADIQRQLDQIREERALNPVQKPPVNQKLLLALAIALFATAYAIRVLTPHKLTPEEVDALSEEMALKIKNRPKRIHYPILTKIKTGALPPYGFGITLQGELTDTTATSVGLSPGSAETVKKQLADALWNTYQVANAAEISAPKPTSPLPKRKEFGWGMQPVAGSFIYQISGGSGMSTGYLKLHSSLSFTPVEEKELRDLVDKTASQIVDGVKASLDRSLTEPIRPTDTYNMPPPGFSVDLDGRSHQRFSSGSMAVLPSGSAGIAEKLDRSIRAALRQELNPRNGNVMLYNPGIGKRPLPPFGTVTIHAPLGNVVFQIPESVSSKYPTAADVVRGVDSVLAEQIAKAVSQVNPSRQIIKP